MPARRLRCSWGTWDKNTAYVRPAGGADANAGLPAGIDQAAIRIGQPLREKGIVHDPHVRAAIYDDISAFVASLGWTVAGIMPSPIPGGEGNRECFVGAYRR
jgi:hypothetical protein